MYFNFLKGRPFIPEPDQQPFGGSRPISEGREEGEEGSITDRPCQGASHASQAAYYSASISFDLGIPDHMAPEQRSFFMEHGYLYLKAELPRTQVAPIAKYIADELERSNVRSSGLKDLPPFQQIGKLSTMIQRDDLEARLITAGLRTMINTLGGPRLSAGPGQLLISLPAQGTWSTRGLNWHVDITSPDPSRSAGIQAFILLDDVEPQGGGTLVLSGSHKRSGSKELGQRIRSILRENGDLDVLLRDFGLSVVEMSGNAGDVYLMDMRLLHTPAINARKKLRMMATIRYYPT